MDSKIPHCFVTLLFVLVVLLSCQLFLSGSLKADSLKVTEPHYRLPDNARNFSYVSGGVELYCSRDIMKRPITFECYLVTPPTASPHVREEDE